MYFRAFASLQALGHYERLIDNAWVHLFAGTGLKHDRLAALRHFARTTIQGLVLQLQINPKSGEKEMLDLLKASLLLQMQQ
jgi:hypothetical protein